MKAKYEVVGLQMGFSWEGVDCSAVGELKHAFMSYTPLKSN
ncbi:MAG: hypothetical protein N2234_02620 [Planctomycetota bacterium]|nr:hypothetical protein [Planctomycetota bacterium]